MDQPLQTQLAPPAAADTGQSARIVYILYLIGIPVPIALLVGLIMAYVYQDQAPAWVKDHYRLQIRTFWIGLLYGVISIVLSILTLGLFWPLGFGLIAVWIIVRCVKGLQAIEKQQPYANPTTWLW